MVETLLSPIIEKLVDLLAAEVNLLKGVHREAKSLKDELEIIQPFLRDAEEKSEQGEASDATKVWIKQIREVADRIEDVIDEYIYHIKEQHRQHCGFLGSLRKAFKPRYDIANEIHHIKESLHQVRRRGQIYGLRPFEQGSSSTAKNVDAQVDTRMSSLFIEKDELVGIESTSKEVVKMLVEGPSARLVFALVGEGGIGKTTLAKYVYDDEIVRGHFNCRTWITVSQSYSMEKILKTMRSHICPTVEWPSGETGMIQELMQLLKQHLQTKRYVAVFDDVWRSDFWQVMKHALPNNSKGNRIIITTRNKIVADSFKRTPCDIVQELKPWSRELAWELFCKKAFLFDFEGHCPQELEQLSREIISKCEGLPLVIAAVAGLLSTKEKVEYEWRKVFDNLTNEFGMNPQLSSISKILSYSYHDLPYHLKPCYLYFGIFPHDFSLFDGVVYRLWIAEGFIRSKKDKTLEQIAEEYLNELIYRNLVSVELKYGVKRKCQVHDLMREIISTTANELCFHQSFNGNKPSQREKGRRLSIHGTTEINVLKTNEDCRFRSIFFFDMDELNKYFLVGLFENFKLLKVLDFKYAPLYDLPNEVGNLIYLKYLSLRRTKVKLLPKSIGKLCNLQTLDIKNTLVRQLPIEINKLKNLRHLLADSFNEKIEHSLNSYCGVRIEEGIGSLEELQTLRHMEAYPSGVRFLKELQSLRKLKSLDISKVTAEIGKSLGAAINNMNHLKELSLTTNDEDEILDLSCISSPSPFLRLLHLNCRLQQLPDWISELRNLQGLDLCFSRLMNEPLKGLKGLPNLAYLHLHKAYDGEELHFEEGGFRKLKQLKLSKLEGLKVMKINRGALPVLEELYFGPSPLMKEMLSDIQHLTNLKSLAFVDMPKEFVVGLQSDGGPHYWKLQHIPSITFWYNYEARNYDIYKLDSSDLLGHLQEQAN